MFFPEKQISVSLTVDEFHIQSRSFSGTIYTPSLPTFYARLVCGHIHTPEEIPTPPGYISKTRILTGLVPSDSQLSLLLRLLSHVAIGSHSLVVDDNPRTSFFP